MHSVRYCLKKTSSVFPEALANRLTVAMIDGGKEKSGGRDDDVLVIFFSECCVTQVKICNFYMIVNNNYVFIS